MLPVAVAELTELGFDVIPVTPGAKCPPVCAGWQRLAPAMQWVAAPADANPALRGGGDVRALFVDADDKNGPGTAATVQRILAGMGIMPDGDCPVVVTASRVGRQFYARSAVRLDGSYRNLRRDIGAGEVRYGPGAYVLAPGAIVGGNVYTLEEGDLRQLPALDLADVRMFADVDPATATATGTRPGMPRLAMKLLAGDAATLARYPTRSEAEQACIASLVGAGHDFESIHVMFVTHPCAGKFGELWRESERDALRWLRLSYSRAERWSAMHESPGRARGRAAQAWAMARPWPGATGNSDMAVYLAHAEIARQSGALTYAAPVRRLAELAGVTNPTVISANRRLVDAGLVRDAHIWNGRMARLFYLDALQTFTSSTHPNCEELVKACNADAWRFRGLGKSALLVLEHLRATPGATAVELAASTGKHRTTVWRALERMAHMVDPDTGEVLRLVEADGDGWRACDDVDLAAVARAVGTAGAGERQRARHEDERRGFRRAIARAEAGTTPESATAPGERKAMRRAHRLVNVLREGDA